MKKAVFPYFSGFTEIVSAGVFFTLAHTDPTIACCSQNDQDPQTLETELQLEKIEQNFAGFRVFR